MTEMRTEYEIVDHTAMSCLEVILVQMTARRPHGHADLEIGIVLDGSVELIVEQQKSSLNKNDIYVINRYQLHSFLNHTGKNLILAFQIHSDLYQKLTPSLRMMQFETVFHPDHMLYSTFYTTLMGCAHAYYEGGFCFELKTASCLLDALYIIASSPASVVRSEKEYNSARSNTLRLNKIIDYLAEHYTEKVSLEDIAALINVTPFHVSHLIKNLLGISFQDYLNNLRFEHAYHLINQTSLTLLDICIDSGFSSSRVLNQMFIKRLGMGAREYRKKQCTHLSPIRELPAENIQKRLSFEAGRICFAKQYACRVPALRFQTPGQS